MIPRPGLPEGEDWSAPPRRSYPREECLPTRGSPTRVMSLLILLVLSVRGETSYQLDLAPESTPP